MTSDLSTAQSELDQAARRGDLQAWSSLWPQVRHEPLNLGHLMDAALSGRQPKILAEIFEHSDGRTTAAFCRKATAHGLHRPILDALPYVNTEAQPAVAGYVLRDSMKRGQCQVITDFFSDGNPLAATLLDDYLLLAMQQNNAAVLQAFLAAGGCGTPTLLSSYVHAARMGRTDWLDQLNPHVKYARVPVSALKEAVDYGQATAVRWLMERRPELVKECSSLLRVSVNRGDLDTVTALLDHQDTGAEPSFLPIRAALGNSHAAIIEALLAHTDTRALETHLAGLQLWAHLDVLLGFLPMERTQHHLAEPAHAPHLPGVQARFLAHERHERAAPHASRTAKPRARC